MTGMKAYRIDSPDGLDALKQVDLPRPAPGPGEILVRVRACSLNYRDLSMPHGGYPRNDKSPLIPLSDGAGEVAAVGPGVTEFAEGDRVAGCFFQDWEDGDVDDAQMGTALGGGLDGMLAEYVVLRRHGAVKIPAAYSFEQAACLPCAAVTAWQALTLAGLKPGDTILALGTGGVSIFALQLAKAAGARVIITSSSDQKLERARSLGADETVNYKTVPDWDKAVLELTDGIGVDNVIEVGGVGTLKRSFKAARVSGTVSLIGVLSGRAESPNPLIVMRNRLTLRGIYVGSRRMFLDLNRALEVNGIEPVIDQTFAFDQARAAFEQMLAAKHFGKIVIKV